MQTRESELKDIVLKKNEDAIISFFEDLDAKERRSLHPVIKEIFRDLNRQNKDNNQSRWTDEVARIWRELNGLRSRASLALLFTGTRSEILARKALPDEVGQLFWGRRNQDGFENHPLIRVIKQLRPDWADEFIDNALSREFFPWAIPFILYRDGLISLPQHPAFYLRLYNFIGLDPKGGQYFKAHPFLEEHHQILAPVIYQSFIIPEAESIQRSTLERGEMLASYPANKDKDIPKDLGWRYAILQATGKGMLDRQRLCETIFTGLAMHAKPSICKWLFELFDALCPNKTERLQWIVRDDLGILHALSAPSNNTRLWALKHLDIALKENAISPETLFERLPPILQSDKKVLISKGLIVLDKIAKKDPQLKGRVAGASCEALLFEDESIQRKVLKLLRDCSDPRDPDIASALSVYAESIIPTLRNEFLPWMGDELLDMASQETEDFVPEPLPDPLDEQNRLEPFTDLDDFIAQISYWYQNPKDSDLLQRILNSFGHNNEHPATELRRRSQALVKLMSQPSFSLGFDGYGHRLKEQLGIVIEAWLGTAKTGNKLIRGLGKIFAKLPSFKVSESLFGAYGGMICRHIATEKNFQLVSAPTHSGGRLDPSAFIQRVIDAGKRGIDPIDMQIALLRLPAAGSGDALAAAQKAKAVDYIRYALGDDSVSPGKNDHLWLAAIRSRHGYQNFRDAQQWANEYDEPDALYPTSYKLSTLEPRKVEHRHGSYMRPAEIIAELDRRNGKKELPYSKRHFYGKRLDGWGSFTDDDFSEHQWNCSAWPSNRIPYFLLAINQLSNNVEMTANQYNTETELAYMQWLTLPPHELGELGHLALAMGLNSAYPTTRQAAVDALVQNISCNFIHPPQLAAALNRMLAIHYAKVNRLVPSLSEITSASHHHSEIICQSLCQSLDLKDKEPPRLFNQLLEFIIQLQAKHPDIRLSPESANYLSILPAKGKTKTLIKKLRTNDPKVPQPA